MKYDYMVKERPNIYQPSRGGFGVEGSTTKIPPTKPLTASEFVQNNHLNNDDGDEQPQINYINRVDGLDIDSVPNDNDDDDDDNDRYPMDIERNENDREYRFQIDNVNDDGVNGSENAANVIDDDHKLDAFVPKKQLCTNNRRSTSALKPFSSINGLDSIMEIREKLPANVSENVELSPQKLSKDGLKNDDRGIDAPIQRPFQLQLQSQENSLTKKKPIAINERNIIRPEENWRYRSNSNPIEYNNPIRFNGYRNFANNMNYQNTSPPSSTVNSGNNINNNNINNNNCRKNNNNFNYGIQNRHHQYNNDYQNYAANGKFVRGKHHATAGIDANNWRNECIYNSTRNCGMSHNADLHRGQSVEMDEDMLSIGLSPPSESLLMQRRMQNRASEIAIRGPQPATASG